MVDGKKPGVDSRDTERLDIRLVGLIYTNQTLGDCTANIQLKIF